MWLKNIIKKYAEGTSIKLAGLAKIMSLSL
jgi:hypothetical protein